MADTYPEAEERVLCRDCNRRAVGFCHSNQGGFWAGFEIPPELRNHQPLRCIDFAPRPDIEDRRTGRQRWPFLAGSVAKRKEETDHVNDYARARSGSHRRAGGDRQPGRTGGGSGSADLF